MLSKSPCPSYQHRVNQQYAFPEIETVNLQGVFSSYCQIVGRLAMKTEATTAPTELTKKQIADMREAFAYFDRWDFYRTRVRSLVMLVNYSLT